MDSISDIEGVTNLKLDDQQKLKKWVHGEKVAAPPMAEKKSVDKWDKSLAEGDYKVEYATTKRAKCRQ
jgi:hypothetical protein